ncbi:hypothetical protein LFL96_15320 [Paraburkholderia sp. D15]|uniref:hypothetical protein n=1 Tax=Paraburkholderia sp. D15 TaxID=2880218 RepID=UPI00247959F4|nr:hypothetical protein [Paraburkholderia sp. D15]WGS49122.1 hypothetical protein LFL96_15320 [Paraburkholderia sp. D15]
MRILVPLFLVVVAFTGCADRSVLPSRQDTTSSQELTSFNHSAAWDDVSAQEMDRTLLAQFKGRPFVCRQAQDHTPEESAAAAKAFAEFVQYTTHGNSVPDFWDSEAARKKRLDLIRAAIKAGSWKAEYVDSVWAFRVRGDAAAHQDAARRLEKLAAQGIPIAAYTYATYLEQVPQEQERVMSEAIDRGSPDAMVWVGGDIVVRSKQLRPAGKAMLECAMAQGDGEAYDSLGVLADMEGRKVDAYRLWEKGVNNGCSACIGHLEGFARIRADYDPSRGTTDATPALKQIGNFYSDNSLFEWTRLPDLYRPLTDDLSFHVSDGDILKLLKLQASLHED